MYYPEELIEEVRTRNDIVEVISGYVRLQKKGSNYFGLCPFHNEKTPSFSVTPAKQMYYCFGCGAGGNVFNFVLLAFMMVLFGINGKEMLQNLRGVRWYIRINVAFLIYFSLHTLVVLLKEKLC